MAVTVEEMTDADARRGFDILSDAFAQDHEFINIVYPKHDTEAGRQVGAQRLIDLKKTQPYAKFFKAVDGTTGEMIGMAKWLVFKDEIPEEGGLGTTEFWETAELANYADYLAREYLIERRKAIRESGGNIVCLDLLIVDPKHHRKGAGRALIQWGLDKADELGVDTVVEASDRGVNTYEATGFKNVKHVTVTPPAAFAHRPLQTFHWMVRPRKTSA